MGIERARVVEVYAPSSVSRRVGSGYVVGDRLVLTAGGLVGTDGPTRIRPAGTATWLGSAVVWAAPSGTAAVVEIEDPAALMLPPERMPFGRITGRRPLAVTAMGVPSSSAPADWPRDAMQFIGHVVPADDGAPLAVTANEAEGNGMDGAALFAGAELVGVLAASADRLLAVSVAAMAGDTAFVDLFGDAGELKLTPVGAPSFGLPIL